MKILVSGSTGLVGVALAAALREKKDEIVSLVRRPATGTGEVAWDPTGETLDGAAVEGMDAAIHLAGENVAARRWTAEQKAKIRDSRVQGTYLIASTLAKLKEPPRTLICASAVGYYGDRGNDVLKETSESGTDFLSEVCRKWEAAAKPAADAGIRVVFLRYGVILSPKGGALAKMLPPFRLGVGGKIGAGQQHMSWISLDDAIGATQHALSTESLSGPVNVVTPHPVTNVEFTKTLGRVLRRPTVLPMPAFAARLAFGKMADGLLLSSQRVEPAKLLASGYEFRHANLEPALRHLLGEK